jgi:hypothetical protein
MRTNEDHPLPQLDHHQSELSQTRSLNRQWQRENQVDSSQPRGKQVDLELSDLPSLPPQIADLLVLLLLPQGVLPAPLLVLRHWELVGWELLVRLFQPLDDLPLLQRPGRLLGPEGVLVPVEVLVLEWQGAI